MPVMEHKAHTDKTVVVIGAGIIGLLSALEIQRLGHRVILMDPGPPGGEQSASYGNGSWLSPASIMPMSMPGLWRKIPSYLTDPSGPFVIRWRHLPSLAPWLFRFLRAGWTWSQIEVCARHRYRLCRETVAGHLKWARQAQADHLIERRGLWFVYPNKEALDSEAREWEMRRELGVRFSTFDSDALRKVEPSLSERYKFGIRVDDGAFITDTRSYCQAHAALLRQQGGLVLQARAIGFGIEDGRLTHVMTETGPVACDTAVVAAGAWSGELARKAGDEIPLISERGYHVVLEDIHDIPHISMMPSDGKMVVTPTLAGLRIAGQVELASLEAPPDWRRTDVLLDFGKKMLPGLAGRVSPERVRRWMGHRPSSPDGLPVIGPASRLPAIVYAFGHGHSGMIQAPETARIVAAIVNGVADGDCAAFSPRRFKQ